MGKIIKTENSKLKSWFTSHFKRAAKIIGFSVTWIFLVALMVLLYRHLNSHFFQSVTENSETNSWRSFGLISFSTLIFIIIACWGYRYKPIQRDRLLFARSWGLALYSFLSIILILGFLFTVALSLNVKPSMVLHHDQPTAVVESKDDGQTKKVEKSSSESNEMLNATEEATNAIDANKHDNQQDEDENTSNLVWNIISHFADPGNLPNSAGGGRMIALLCALAGILCLSGLVVSSLVSMVSRRTQRWRKGLIRYNRKFRNYVVVIGCNKQASTIIRNSLDREDVDYVLVQTRNDVEKERSRLELTLERAYEERVVFYFGERTLYEDIRNLNLEKAKEVYILGEEMDDEREQDHDSFNMTCLQLISRYFKESNTRKATSQSISRLIAWHHESSRLNRSKSVNTTKLKCHVNLEYQSTYTIFKFTHIYKSLNQNIEFIPFNTHEIWAKKVLVDNYAIIPGERRGDLKVQRYLPLDCYVTGKDGSVENILPDTEKAVHLFVIGMNQMGNALAMQAAMLVHLPNFHSKGMRTTITFIDEHAKKEGEYLKGRFTAMFELCIHRTVVCGEGETPVLSSPNAAGNWTDPMIPLEKGRFSHLGPNFMDLQWEFIEGNVASKEIQNYMSACCEDKHKTVTIAVCQNNPQQSIATALCLPETVLRRALQVLVYQRNTFDLITKVATGEKEWKRYAKLRPFGMTEDCYTGNMFENIRAKLTMLLYERHGLHRLQNLTHIIDRIDRRWSEEGIVNKLSNINLTDSIPLKLRSAGYKNQSQLEITNAINNKRLIELLCAAEHQRWLTERLTMGYRPPTAAEINFFYQDITPEERKSRKEYLKSKSRVHIDICSYDLLEKIDNTKENDRRIILNTLQLTFKKQEARIIIHLAQKELAKAHGKLKKISSPQLRLCACFLNEMVVIPKRKFRKFDIKKRKYKNKHMDSIWFAKTSVTQKLWCMVMGNRNNPSSFKGKDRPVENVSLLDVRDFITILNDRTGLHFRLPTKDEWQNAAYGTWSPQNFPKNKNDLAEYAWFDEEWDADKGNAHRNRQSTHPVNKKKANSLGLSDMLGNVWEWVNEKHGPSTYCFCGGSWRFSEKECDLTDEEESWCNYWTPDFSSSDLGFRLVLPYRFNKVEKDTVLRDEKLRMGNEIVKSLREVPAGLFWMGTSYHISERHLCLIRMSRFLMADSVVTQRQWKAFMGVQANLSSHKGDNYPVENVSYLDAQLFIRKLNDYVKSQTSYKKDLFSLPSESQWEYAAKLGNKPVDRSTDSTPLDATHIPSPDSYFVFSAGVNPDDEAWHNGITKCTNDVKRKKPNSLGIYDLCGNVWEWCNDWYQADYFKNLNPENDISKIKSDPEGPTHGCARVMRGGSWKFTAWECRVSRFTFWTEDYRSDDVGFRLAVKDVAGYEQVKKELNDKF